MLLLQSAVVFGIQGFVCFLDTNLMWQRDRAAAAAAAAAAGGKSCAGRAAARDHVEVAAEFLSETCDHAPGKTNQGMVVQRPHKSNAPHIAYICNDRPKAIPRSLPTSPLAHCSIAWDALPPDRHVKKRNDTGLEF
jgi:hypothetical protein